MKNFKQYIIQENEGQLPLIPEVEKDQADIKKQKALERLRNLIAGVVSKHSDDLHSAIQSLDDDALEALRNEISTTGKGRVEEPTHPTEKYPKPEEFEKRKFQRDNPNPLTSSLRSSPFTPYVSAAAMRRANRNITFNDKED